MSNSEDIDAIDMFVKGKMSLVATHPPLGAVIDEWNTFAKSVKGSWWISDADVAKAKLIRDRINAAAGEADLVALGFKPADNPAYQVPLDQILGKTGAEIAAAEKKQTALRESTAQKQPLLDVGSKDKRAIMIAQSIVGVKPTGIYDVKITKPAVVKWQKMRKINPASGKFGPLSWASSRCGGSADDRMPCAWPTAIAEGIAQDLGGEDRHAEALGERGPPDDFVGRQRRVDRAHELLLSKPQIEDLTPTERRILKLVGEDHTSKEIAEFLKVSVRTVENHRQNICKKLNLHGTHSLLKFAFDNSSYL
jgi:DNA-binding CsgD family transcriptional regulator